MNEKNIKKQSYNDEVFTGKSSKGEQFVQSSAEFSLFQHFSVPFWTQISYSNVCELKFKRFNGGFFSV